MSGILNNVIKEKFDKKLKKFIKRSTLADIKLFARRRSPSLLGTRRKLGQQLSQAEREEMFKS